MLSVDNGTQHSALFFGVVGGAYSTAAAAQWIGRNSTTNRSINAGGTINASGADYAEYMAKAEGVGTIAAGDVCGVNPAGELVTAWAEAHSFVVKSTDPAYVGGDSWAQDVGPKPEAPDEDASEAKKAQHATALAAWEAELEVARQCVDRIAFSGQVPVNVGPATLTTVEQALADGDGIYLVAEQKGTGIAATAVLEREMTLPLYMRRLGKVWAIRDGRPWIDVQHG